MLPTFRLFFVAVAIVIAALAVAGRGLVTPSEGYTRIGDVPGVGRALVQQAIVRHPDARKMHVLASARRADELERLRDLPAPSAAPAQAAPSDPIAELLKQLPVETPAPVAAPSEPPAEALQPIVTGALAPAALPDAAPQAALAPADAAPADTAAPDTAPPAEEAARPPEPPLEVAVAPAPATDPVEDAPRPDPTQHADLPSESDGLAAESSEPVSAIAPALPRPRPAVADRSRPIMQVRRKPRAPRIALPRAPRIAATSAHAQRAAAPRPPPAPAWSATNSVFGISPSQTSGQ